jgi:hypothetical protein
MKAPREAVQAAVQVAKKGNGSSKTVGMMANACAEQNDAVPSHEEMIAVSAYFRAEHRGFASGCEMDDWFQAEHDVNALAKTSQ